MRGLLGGLLSGGCVSVLGLSVASIVAEQPAGRLPPAPPLVQAPEVDAAPVTAEVAAEPLPEGAEPQDPAAPQGATTPVGSLSVEAPPTPELPQDTAVEVDAPDVPQSVAPVSVEAEATAPAADTDPLDAPEVMAIEGAMEAPEASADVALLAEPVDPVLPNPQSMAPQTPASEADLTVSTAPAAPTVVEDPEPEAVVILGEPETGAAGEPAGADAEEVFVVDPAPAADDAVGEQPDGETFVADVADDAPQADAVASGQTEEETFVLDEGQSADQTVDASPAASAEDETLALVAPQPGLQLQGAENTLLSDRDTGVVIRRPGADEQEAAEAQADVAASMALEAYGADFAGPQDMALMSIILIDDGSMSAAAAALSGLGFPVTIAVDADQPGAEDLMAAYRADGFEVVVLAELPEGAQPSDVEVTFESVFGRLPESIGLLDLGRSGLQADQAVTEQAMQVLAERGAGFVSASQGLNMAGRAAEQAGVPAAIVYRDLDSEGQDARVVRRFVDQAAFRARQESGVVLVGRVRPDTISALILWGTANDDEQVALVPLSTLLMAQ